MKFRRFLCALLCGLLLAGTAPTAQAAGLRASIATGKVTLNGQAIDNTAAQYPLLVYRNITYFPMTYHLCRFLGLHTEWDSASRTLSITPNGDIAEYVADTGHKSGSGRVTVSRVDYPVVVGGETVDNSAADWPLLNYSGVTYFPLTWAFAVEQFGWTYHWDEKDGLQIDCAGGGAETDLSGSTGSYRDSEAINSATRAWATAAWGSSPEDLTVELDGNWTLEAIKKAIGDALAEHVKGTLLEGRLTEVTIPYSFQFPASMKAGDVLKVPYTAAYHGDTRVLPSGNTFTPSSTSEEAVASVRLTGQGSAVPVDSAFQAGREIYLRLEACTKLAELELAAGSETDVPGTVRTAIDAKMAAAGLAEQYRIQAISTGAYTQPGSMAAGESETIDFQVMFTPLREDAPTDAISISGQLTVRIRYSQNT